MKSKSIAIAVVSILATSACASNSLTTTTPPGPAAGSSAAARTPAVDAALAAKLPEKVKKAKKIVVGTNPAYAPVEMLAADGKTIEGIDVDLFNAVAAKFGVTAEFQAGPFDSLISGIDAKKYDIGVSGFTINAARMEKNNMVSYFSAGTRWAVAAGNPKKIDPAAPCGHMVAVQTGTIQAEELIPALQAKCGEKKITVASYDSQAEATASVVAGKNDATVADSPIVDYAVKQAAGKLEAAGEMFDAAPYGYVIPKDQTEFASAVVEALTALKTDGTYDAILAKWGVEGGAVKTFELNPKV